MLHDGLTRLMQSQVFGVTQIQILHKENDILSVVRVKREYSSKIKR